MRVLVLNSGSSSIKYQVVDSETGERVAGGVVEEVDDHDVALGAVIERLGTVRPDAVGHRVVHGGERFSAPTIVDDELIGAVRALIPLAPLHNPANLAGIEVARRLWPDVVQVAVFDTAFHRTLPAHAYRYAVPEEWYVEQGVRRYGFHGTSHEYVATVAAQRLGRSIDEVDLIVAHLGNGASVTAVANGRSVETSMGLSPLEGLVMGTRSGDVDPMVLAHVAGAAGRPIELVLDDLNTASGLAGLCGSSDMREVVARADDGDESAALALAVFAHRIKKYLGAYMAVLGGCDAIVFTAGIGEHNPRVRAAACSGLEPLGVVIDPDRNVDDETTISTDDSPVAVLVVPTDEEHAIALHTASLVAQAGRGARAATDDVRPDADEHALGHAAGSGSSDPQAELGGASLDRFAGLGDAMFAGDWDLARTFLAPDFRHRIRTSLSIEDFDVDEYIEHARIWRDLAGSARGTVGAILRATEHAVLYEYDLTAVSEAGSETAWSALIVAVARGDKLTHYEEFDPRDTASALARFEELTGGAPSEPLR